MQETLDTLLKWWTRAQQWLDGFVVWAQARVGLATVLFAVMAAGGVLVLMIGLFSTRRVNLNGEAARLAGVEELGVLGRLQMRLYQSGIRVKVHEFLIIGLGLGALLGGAFLLLGFASVGIIFIVSGPFIYYQYLMQRRIKQMRLFREELPLAIYDTRDHLTARANDLKGAVIEMALRGPRSLREDFDYATRLMDGGVETAAMALRQVARSREEPFFRQFFDALANHPKGGDTATVLTRVAQGQKAHNRLQAKTRAKQSGLRMVGLLYMIAPPAFVLFMAFAGGIGAREFYTSPLGQLVQMLAVCAGVMSYWLSSRISRRGLYLDESTGARLIAENIPSLMMADEFGEATDTHEPEEMYRDSQQTGWTLPPERSLFGASEHTHEDAAIPPMQYTVTASRPVNGSTAIPAPTKNTDLATEDQEDFDHDSADDFTLDELRAFQDLDLDQLLADHLDIQTSPMNATADTARHPVPRQSTPPISDTDDTSDTVDTSDTNPATHPSGNLPPPPVDLPIGRPSYRRKSRRPNPGPNNQLDAGERGDMYG